VAGPSGRISASNDEGAGLLAPGDDGGKLTQSSALTGNPMGLPIPPAPNPERGFEGMGLYIPVYEDEDQRRVGRVKLSPEKKSGAPASIRIRASSRRRVFFFFFFFFT